MFAIFVLSLTPSKCQLISMDCRLKGIKTTQSVASVVTLVDVVVVVAAVTVSVVITVAFSVGVGVAAVKDR